MSKEFFEHLIASELRGWLWDWLKTDAAQRLRWNERLRLRWWSWCWPENLHAFHCLIKDSTGRAEQVPWHYAGVPVRVKFRACLRNPVPLTWMGGHTPKFYAERI